MVLGLQTENNPVPVHPFWNFADISYLKEQFKLHQMTDVCTLSIRGLACYGLLCMLPYQFKNILIKSLRNRKGDIKLSVYLKYSCSLHAEYLCYIKSVFNKYTASYGVICVTFIKLTF